MNSKTAHADVIGSPQGALPGRPARPRVAQRDLFSMVRAFWAACRRANRARRPLGELAALDARVLRDIGFTRSAALGVATRHLPADDVARYRDRL